MTRTLHELRRRVANTPVNGRGYKQYSRSLRQQLVEYAARRRAAGDDYKTVARELGLSCSTLSHWCQEPPNQKPDKQPVGFRPVSLQAGNGKVRALHGRSFGAAAAGSRAVVVLPGGARIEGLAMDDLVELVRRLGCL